MERTKQMQECIDHCTRCFQGCTEAIPYSFKKGGNLAAGEHIKMLIETAEMCKMNASFMLMQSKHSKEHCHLCAKVCDSCAQACGSFDDQMMKQMSENLKKCAETCRNM